MQAFIFLCVQTAELQENAAAIRHVSVIQKKKVHKN